MKKRSAGTVAIGKLVRHVSRVRGKGGSALPGLVAEKLRPGLLSDMLGDLPDGVVVVTGTNGKTTTTKMIADLFTSLGKHVLTNKTGSNFTRGIAATIIKEAKLGKPLHHDMAVIELDEAHATHFVKIVKPDYVVALNVMRDQLDRFGEIDTTARLIERVLKAATKACVINGDDPHLHALGEQLDVPVRYYTVDKSLQKYFPTDAELLAVSDHSEPVDTKPPVDAAVQLAGFEGQTVQYRVAGKVYEQKLNVTGQYNFQNAAAALALAQLLVPGASVEKLLQHLGTVTPAFGRGETLTVNGQPLEMVLVKNPAGFRSGLHSFTTPAATMIAINDHYADSRDMSWLWDVDFSSLQQQTVSVVSGLRAYDMALRLRYDEVPVGTIESDLDKALQQFLRTHEHEPKRIFCTYTAMLSLHAKVAKLTGTEHGL